MLSLWYAQGAHTASDAAATDRFWPAAPSGGVRGTALPAGVLAGKAAYGHPHPLCGGRHHEPRRRDTGRCQKRLRGLFQAYRKRHPRGRYRRRQHGISPGREALVRLPQLLRTGRLCHIPLKGGLRRAAERQQPYPGQGKHRRGKDCPGTGGAEHPLHGDGGRCAERHTPEPAHPVPEGHPHSLCELYLRHQPGQLQGLAQGTAHGHPVPETRHGTRPEPGRPHPGFPALGH